MASINKIKVEGNDYNIAVGEAIFSYPIEQDKGWGKCFTISGFNLYRSSRQLEFMLRGPHCPSLFVMVKYQNYGGDTLDSCDFSITAVNANNEDTHVVFSKGILAGSGYLGSAQLHIWCKLWDFNTITLVNPPANMQVYNYLTTQYKSQESFISNTIPVKYIFDTTNSTPISPFKDGKRFLANQSIFIAYNKGVMICPLDASGVTLTFWSGKSKTIYNWTSIFNRSQQDDIITGSGAQGTYNLYYRYQIEVNGSSLTEQVLRDSNVGGKGVEIVNAPISIKANKSVWVAYL